MKKWTEEEIKFLIDNYKIYGLTYCSTKLDRNKNSVNCKAIKLNLQRKKLGLSKVWSDNEIQILKQFYPTEGALVYKRLPDRTGIAIKSMSIRLKIKNVIRLSSRKEIIEKFSNNRVSAKCIHHGVTKHTFYNSRPACIKCDRKQMYESRKNGINKYKHRIQSQLRNLYGGKIGFSKDLPYTAKELTSYLDNILAQQNSHCPMCHVSYNINPFDIDHIMPKCIANNKEELIYLYRLENLTLLCFKCNRFIKRDKIIIEGGI